MATEPEKNQPKIPMNSRSKKQLPGGVEGEAPDKAPEGENAPGPGGWFEILSSPMATTLITVVVGSILGQLILSHYQDQEKRREMAQEELRATIEKRQDTVQQALDRIGAVRFDAEAHIQLTHPENDPRYAHNPQEKKEMTQRIDKVFDNHLQVLQSWYAGQRESGLLLAYYNFGDERIKTAWDTTAETTTSFLNCAVDAYKASQSPGAVEKDPCSNERKAADAALEKLSDAFEVASQDSWQDLKPSASKKDGVIIAFLKLIHAE